MRILILQFASAVRGRCVPRFEPQLGVLMALLAQRGHELSLLGVWRYDEAQVKQALARSLPQLIYADVSCVCVDTARRVLQYVQQREFLPVIAGGSYATVDTPRALSLPGVHAAVRGEPDASLVTYFERMKDPAAGQVVLGVWMRDERGLARPGLPPLVEALDSLPHPERELFGYAAHVRRTGELEVSVGRGCPQSCAYCLDPAVAALYAGQGIWTRRRPAADVLDEIEQLRATYPEAQHVRFLDHAFALDDVWLEEMLSEYARRCELPMRCHLRANAVTPQQIGRLAAAGCRLADVEVISASDFIRNEIFAMDLSEEQLVSAFEALRAAGILTRAILYLGAPYENELSLEAAGSLLLRLRPDFVDARPYYPFPGTRAAEICRENGWLRPRGEWHYHNEQCGIDMPACRAERVEAYLRRLRAEFPAAPPAPWWRRWTQTSRATWGQLFLKRP